MPSAGSQAPGAKSSGCSLRLSRWRCSRRLPQPAAWAATVGGDNAGGDGGLAENMPREGQGKASASELPYGGSMLLWQRALIHC